ncbi:MAG: hypothetical protein MZV64_29675 [Ignavibacteriales bacterium]|nr:hypothetical protein [Ignavibacteriales bacterium]
MRPPRSPSYSICSSADASHDRVQHSPIPEGNRAVRPPHGENPSVAPPCDPDSPPHLARAGVRPAGPPERCWRRAGPRSNAAVAILLDDSPSEDPERTGAPLRPGTGRRSRYHRRFGGRGPDRGYPSLIHPDRHCRSRVPFDRRG